MTRSGRRGHEGAFRALLRVYPAWFRRAHGEEMQLLFSARLGRARGPGAVVRLWAHVLGDALATAAKLRRNPPGGRRLEKERGGRGMGTLAHDVRYAARHLVRAPAFTLSAVVILAVGIGANTAVFTVVDRVLFRPPPWDRPDEVVHVYQDSDDGEPSSSSFPAYRDMVASGAFTAAAAMSPSTAAWEGPDGPVSVSVEYTTASYMDVLGLSVSRGRWFGAEHDVAGTEPVAVVSAPAWRVRLGGDPDVIGRTIRLNGQPVTIVGVGPEALPGSYAPVVTDFWLSISATVVGGPYQVANLEYRTDHWYDVRARLAPGVTVARAQAAMDALAARFAEEFPELDRGRDITVFRARDVRFHPGSDGELFAAAGVLTGVVGIVLLLACANLANLLLVRGIGRSGEMAVRRALGAGTGRVARLFLAESLLLSTLGGALGVLLARWTLAALHTLPLPFPLSATLDLAMDWRVGLFCVALMGATGVLFGLAPALRSAREDVARALRDDRRTASMGRGTARLRNALVAVQVGASLVLVLGAGILGRSLAALQDVDTGVDADRVAFVRTSVAQAGYQGAEIGVALEEVRARVEALPGVTRAAAASRLPAQRSGTTTTVVEGYTPSAGTEAVELNVTVVTPEYFETVGLPLVEGRTFTDDDVAGAERVVVVNRAAARRFWGGVAPVGRRMRSQGQPDAWRTVVGVVEDAPVASLAEPTRPMFYVSAGQSSLATAYVLARTDGDPGALLAPMRGQVQAVRASLSITSQGTLASHLSASMAAPRLAAGTMGAFSLFAVLLAGLGIYAVVSFSVARRSGELGIRIALGAERSRVVRMVVREVVGTVSAGIVGGIAVAALVAPRLEGVVFGVRTTDPANLAGAVLFLAAVAGVAAWVPARRAARADPVEALRAS